jgi:hypothetical protein
LIVGTQVEGNLPHPCPKIQPDVKPKLSRGFLTRGRENEFGGRQNKPYVEQDVLWVRKSLIAHALDVPVAINTFFEYT